MQTMSILCTVEPCDGTPYAKGWCRRHYDQMRKHGRILTRTRRDPNEFRVLADRVEMDTYDNYGAVTATTIFDPEDLPLVEGVKWSVGGDEGRKFYIVHREDGKTIYLHRQLLGEPPFERAQVDHINRDTMDNRRVNLRWVTVTQNHYNRRGWTDLPKGVKRYKGHYMAQITRTFDTLEEAVAQRKEWETMYHGEYAYKGSS